MAKRVPPLSSAQVANLKPDPTKVVELVDGAVPGLRLRVTPAGTRSWSLNIRAAGIMRRFDVGAGLGLAEARKKAEDLRRQIREGVDPTAERSADRARAKAAAQGIGTFGAMIDAYFLNGRGAGLRSKKEQLKRLRSVFAEHLSRPALEIDGAALQKTLDAHGAKTAAARAVAYLGPVLKWAAKPSRSLVKVAFDLEKPHADVEEDEESGVGQRVLTHDELRAILPHLNDPHGRCCKFLLLTAARLREATEATWAEIDRDAGTWTVSPGRRKDTRSRTRRKQVPSQPHIVPLSRQTLELLEEVRAAERLRRELSGITAEISDDDPIFIGERGGRLQNWDRWLKLLSPKTGISGWSAHTLRRTAATLAADIGAEPHVISILLGHKNVGGQLTAGYSKSRYRREHEEALQRLADHIDAIENGASRATALGRG
jgi:integrase